MKVRLMDVELYPCLGIEQNFPEWAIEDGEVYEIPNELIESFFQKRKELDELESRIRKYMNDQE